ncbi:MAG: hypothetical protein KF901_05015, partial [Myxococcales bacterium]|nr:hypothetical protein [Myxococcales bacterium]
MIVSLGWAAALAAQPTQSTQVTQSTQAEQAGQAEQASESLAALVTRHADDEALALLDRLAPTAGHRYLRGRLLERQGRLAEAARAYAEALADRDPLPDAVASDARFRGAHALARLGRCADARPLFEAASPTGARRGIARALGVECEAREALGGGRRETLEPLLADLERVARDTAAVRGVDTFSLRALRAEVLERLGRVSEARDARLALFVELPDHPDGGQLAALLGGDTATSLALLTPAQRLARADALFSAHRFEEAVETLRGVEPPSAIRGAWLHRLGMSLYRARHHYAEAARVLAASARERHPHAQVDAFHAARALARADRDAEAIVAL